MPETQTSPTPDGVWLDKRNINPTWAPPAGGAALRRRPIPAPAVYGAVALAAVLLVVTIWGFGGFERRTDALIDTAVGTPVITGPYEFRFTEVTAQRTNQFDGTIAWELTAIGTGRNTGEISISPSATGEYGMFASKDDASGETARPTVTGSAPTTRTAGTPSPPDWRRSPTRSSSSTARPIAPDRRCDCWCSRSSTATSRCSATARSPGRNTVYAYQFRLPVRVLPENTY